MKTCASLTKRLFWLLARSEAEERCKAAQDEAFRLAAEAREAGEAADAARRRTDEARAAEAAALRAKV